MFSESHISFFQSIFVIRCPDIWFIGICIQNIIIAEPQTIFFIILSHITLYIYMLSKHKIL